jgi:hypothetical protein
MLFPNGQSSTGWLALGLALLAAVLFFANDVLGVGGRLLANLACGGSTLLAFILGTYAHIERHGRVEAARAALFISVSLIVYFMYARLTA